MSDLNNKDEHFAKAFSKLVNLVIVMLIIIIGLIVALIHFIPDYIPELELKQQSDVLNISKTQVTETIEDKTNYWQAPEISTLEGNILKNDILYGKEIIAHTADFFGPNGKVFKASTNGLNCQNCHLEVGTKVFGNNYGAVASTYPKYRARSGAIENIYKRVNDCFERSLNGKALDTSSKEMQSIVAYIKWLGTNVGKGKKPEGSGFKEISFLERAANPDNGKLVYVQKCQSCHQANGEGVMNGDKSAFTYPPLWGKKSYNSGAGLFRLSNFAKFVKYNMPLGASHNSSQLTDEEAWDIAAFVNSQPRPSINIKKDWPKIKEKPFDHPFGPFADGFSEHQHKFGPFKPIIEKNKALKK